ncbi:MULTISPECIES: hypothetical protein [unclassified Sinorhizobium]|uniref:hypothetical protein n=1 Tax=unclassified Sinorhizobium TaxID=2613772 RepID=UPI0035240E4C
MLSPETTIEPSSARRSPSKAADPMLPLELLEMQLSLDGYDEGEAGFREAVQKAAKSADGELLFDLPATGLIENCSRLAVIRIPDGEEATRIVFALLDEESNDIRVQVPNEETEHLVRFANAFVGVLEQM